MISNYLVCTAALGASLFVIAYAALAPFYRSEEGWNVMTFMVVVVLMIVQSVYFRLSGTRAPEWLSSLDWGLINAVVWWRFTLVIRRQLARRRSTK